MRIEVWFCISSLLKLKNSGSGIIPVAEILFDTRPKSRREDFFDRDKEIEEL
ncbi:hypothetical protein [Acidianus hospitalis]|uniref:hypothetical protein n=1 Tax=Acidianus hospitalis TaxID=563177 RepID=UPI0016518A38|nr:hypothetical protein [Acidianus hospitalis]